MTAGNAGESVPATERRDDVCPVTGRTWHHRPPVTAETWPKAPSCPCGYEFVYRRGEHLGSLADG